MISDKIWQRSDFLGTQVITRDTGKRLGVVNQVWVDVDRREVVALSLRENLLAGIVGGEPRYMLLSSIRQIGDVILVENDDAIEDINVDGYSKLIQSEVITETGEPLGKVRGFLFNVEDGRVSSLIIASIGLPQIPDQIISTYELPIEEVVSSGPDRLIVFEGSEERLNQLTTGLLERVGIGKAPWESDDEDDYYRMPNTPASNQLGRGTPTTPPPPARNDRPAIADTTWDEDNWEEAAPPPARRQKYIEPVYDDEEDNWSEASTSKRDRIQNEPYDYDNDSDDEYDDYEEEYEEVYEQPKQQPKQRYMDADDDVWADDPKSYKSPKGNIPDKVKEPEYEDGGY
jgi:sporulation protein YlmC with PRC-barrel domain